MQLRFGRTFRHFDANHTLGSSEFHQSSPASSHSCAPRNVTAGDLLLTNTTGLDVCLERVAGPNAKPASKRARKNDLAFSRNFGLHGKTILPSIVLPCKLGEKPRTPPSAPSYLDQNSGMTAAPLRM